MNKNMHIYMHKMRLVVFQRSPGQQSSLRRRTTLLRHVDKAHVARSSTSNFFVSVFHKR